MSSEGQVTMSETLPPSNSLPPAASSSIPSEIQASTAPKSYFPFFRLPRELRNAIYEEHIGNDGLRHDFSTNKLRKTNGQPID